MSAVEEEVLRIHKKLSKMTSNAAVSNSYFERKSNFLVGAACFLCRNYYFSFYFLGQPSSSSGSIKSAARIEN